MNAQKWEYWVLAHPGLVDVSNCQEMMMYLNAMGDQGWELVSVIPQTVPGMIHTEVVTAFFFKKPKNEETEA